MKYILALFLFFCSTSHALIKVTISDKNGNVIHDKYRAETEADADKWIADVSAREVWGKGLRYVKSDVTVEAQKQAQDEAKKAAAKEKIKSFDASKIKNLDDAKAVISDLVDALKE